VRKRRCAAALRRYHRLRSGEEEPPDSKQVRRSVSLEPPAKFFVNSGLVSSPTDIYNLLRPLLKQTVSYRYFRGAGLVSMGTGWVERIVVDRPEVSTFFTPLSICLNIDSFEHLEFETRPDQLIVYTLVQGDERIVVEFAPVGRTEADEPEQQRFAFPATSDYVQMELSTLDGGDGSDAGGEGSEGS
jgi:hypothetical protein